MRVIVPWRSDPFWSDFDLAVGSTRPTEWFCFHADAGDSVTLTAEAEPTGRGIFVSLFGPDDDDPALAEALSDERGLVALAASTFATGTHYVRVRAWDRHGTPHPQRYRMSIAGPVRARKASTLGRRLGGFSDVPLWHPHHDAVQKVTTLGLMTGWQVGDDLRFGPDHPLWEADFVEIVGAYFSSQGEHVGRPLLDWGRLALAAGAAADPNSGATRGHVLAIAVGALENAFPGLLALPPESGADSQPPANGSHDGWREIAEYNGLLRGIEGFATEKSLESPASRGEMAQLLDSVLQLVESRPAPSDPEGERARTAHAAQPHAVWALESGTAKDFIADANAALDALMGGDPVGGDLRDDAPDGAAEALYAAMAATRDGHEVRPRYHRRAPSPYPGPVAASNRLGANDGSRSGRVTDEGLADSRRGSGRRSARRPSRTKPRT